ncbi:MAG TPA: ATP-binding protein [Acidobacteriota bacterium]|nr:ATP-binding protein [Acidobacteriota bacterium]
MTEPSARLQVAFDRHVALILTVAVAVAVLALTAMAIRKSRTDSFELLVEQGRAFTEALAEASSNAIAAETFYDQLLQKRYADLVTSLTEENLNLITGQDLLRFADAHDLYSVYIYDSSGQMILGTTARGLRPALPEFVDREVSQFFSGPQISFILLTDEEDSRTPMMHYYLQVNSQLDRVVVLACDALYYGEAVRQTGIGYLAQNMAREKGVEYIIYQSTEGIIFASRKPGDLLAIESDPFLLRALESDSILSRRFDFQGETLLELVRPFSTDRFPFGLFRVGLSLDRYYAVSRGLTIQLAVLAAALFCLLLVVILYLNSRHKRRELAREYTRIKSVTDKIFEQMRTGVAAVDGHGVLRLANDAFEQILGLTNVTGKAWSKVAPDERLYLDPFLAGPDQADETEITVQLGGEEKTLLVARSKIAATDADSASAVMVVYDITRLKEFEQVSARRERLSEMGDLAAGVAHEIRNPLNAISIAAQRLAAEFTPRENHDEYRTFTQTIRGETKRLNEIISRFLALSREEKKKTAQVRLDKFFAELGDLLRVEAARLKIELTFDVPPGLTLTADPDLLKQVFQNLFSNAKEAINGQPGRVAVEASRLDDQVRIVFSDSGPGIPEQMREKVFAPYFTTRETGTGLGLATVDRIVSEFGGTMKIAESRWGGAGVIITFPAAGSGA